MAGVQHDKRPKLSDCHTRYGALQSPVFCMTILNLNKLLSTSASLCPWSGGVQSKPPNWHVANDIVTEPSVWVGVCLCLCVLACDCICMCVCVLACVCACMLLHGCNACVLTLNVQVCGDSYVCVCVSAYAWVCVCVLACVCVRVCFCMAVMHVS